MQSAWHQKPSNSACDTFIGLGKMIARINFVGGLYASLSKQSLGFCSLCRKRYQQWISRLALFVSERKIKPTGTMLWKLRAEKIF